MAQSFKPALVSVTTVGTWQSVYTAPANVTTALAYSCQLANIHATNDQNVSIRVNDGVSPKVIGNGIDIPVNSTLPWGKITLLPNWSIEVRIDTGGDANSINANIGVLETSPSV